MANHQPDPWVTQLRSVKHLRPVTQKGGYHHEKITTQTHSSRHSLPHNAPRLSRTCSLNCFRSRLVRHYQRGLPQEYYQARQRRQFLRLGRAVQQLLSSRGYQRIRSHRQGDQALPLYLPLRNCYPCKGQLRPLLRQRCSSQ